jgi:rubrerythrin
VERGERVDELTWYDLAALSLQVQEEMVALYETLLEQVKAEPVQKVLETLAEAEREAGKKLSKKLLSLQEL